MMHMSFYLGTGVTNLLFKGLSTSTVGGFVSLVIGTGCLAILYEGLKTFRQLLLLKAKDISDELPLPTVSEISDEPATSEQSHSGQARLITEPKLKSTQAAQPSASKMHEFNCERFKYHCIQSVLQGVQVVVGYLLMLIVMSYNAWFLISATVGASVGYFFFASYVQQSLVKSLAKEGEAKCIHGEEKSS